jgi:FtsP/CotA-like multicopper oxidase with cupredoxin domain
MKWRGSMWGWGGMWGGGMSGVDKIKWSNDIWFMNKRSNSERVEWKLIDWETWKENMNINWKFKVGDKVKVRIYNDENSMNPMQHPIHFHWQRFLITSKNWQTPNNMVWKDTALIETWEYIDILIDMTNPWDWMSHCHIAEHLTAGMMMSFNVEK